MSRYPTRILGRNGPSVSAIGLGTMGIGAFYGKTDVDEANKMLNASVDRGVTFWDCADIYGNTESVLGDWFSKTGRRKEVFLATKFGATDLEQAKVGTLAPNSKPDYIRRAVKRSLDNLKTDYIDLYYQHRVDPNVPIEIVMKTLGELVDEGVIKYIGLSDCSAKVLRRAKAVPGAGDKLVAVQVEYSPFELTIETNGLLEAARELGISVVAYSPLSRGLVTGRFRSRADFEEGDLRLHLPRFSEENFPKNVELADKLAEMAKKHNATGSQIALAWLIHEGTFPIPGTRTVERFEENAKGAEVKLSDAELKEIRSWIDNADVQGLKTLSQYMSSGDCIELADYKE